MSSALGGLGPGAVAMFEHALGSRVPLTGSLELTHRCNLACRHCYVNLPAADRGAQRRELSATEIARILDELADLGTLYLTLTGGEPLLRPDFAEIYRHAHGRGFLITLYTNATLITDRVVALFTECPPYRIEITQYGATAETYDRVADVGPGPHRHYVRGLARLREAGLRVALKTMAMRSNAHEVLDMLNEARAAGLEFRMDAVLSPRIDGGRGPLKERLTATEIVAIEHGDAEVSAAFADHCRTHWGTPANDSLYQCGAGLTSFVIDPYGRLHLCELSRTLGWDVREHGFARGWYEAIPERRAQKRSHDEGCGSCAAEGTCSNCVGMAELEKRTYEDGNLYFCDLSEARNQAAIGEGRPVPNGLRRLRVLR